MLFEDGALDDAGRLWLAAHDMAETFAADDPRRAASLDALGTLAAKRKNDARAEALYREALDAWQAAQTWVDRMHVAPAARSSMFHLRLETKHRGAYPDITRERQRAICCGGEAAAMGNLAFLKCDPDDIREALEWRRDAFGPREALAATIGQAVGKFVEGRIIDRWIERPPARYDDERRLYAAALLAPCLVPPDD